LNPFDKWLSKNRQRFTYQDRLVNCHYTNDR
jgi:hypothetical protein